MLYDLTVHSAISLHTRVFHIHSKFSPWLLEWNPNTRQLGKNRVFLGENEHFHVWYFNVYIVSGVIGLGSCLDVLFHYGDPEVGLPLLVLAAALGGMSKLFCTAVFVLKSNANDLVEGCKLMQSLHSRLRLQVGTPPRHNGASLNPREFRWDLIVIALKSFTWVMALTPWLLCPGGLYMKLDPFSYTFGKFLTGNNYFNESSPAIRLLIIFIELFFRIVCSFICTVEACRFFAFFFTFFMQIYETILKITTLLNCIVMGSDDLDATRKFLKIYRLYVRISNVYKDSINHMIAIQMGDGFVIFVIANLVTLTCSGFLPIYVYWLMPMTSVACTFFVYALLVTVVEISSRNARAISYMKQTHSRKIFANKSHRILLREVRLLKPVCFSCGSFYPLVRGAETNYFFHVFIRTVDGVLLKLV